MYTAYKPETMPGYESSNVAWSQRSSQSSRVDWHWSSKYTNTYLQIEAILWKKGLGFYEVFTLKNPDQACLDGQGKHIFHPFLSEKGTLFYSTSSNKHTIK